MSVWKALILYKTNHNNRSEQQLDFTTLISYNSTIQIYALNIFFIFVQSYVSNLSHEEFRLYVDVDGGKEGETCPLQRFWKQILLIQWYPLKL